MMKAQAVGATEALSAIVTVTADMISLFSTQIATTSIPSKIASGTVLDGFVNGIQSSGKKDYVQLVPMTAADYQKMQAIEKSGIGKNVKKARADAAAVLAIAKRDGVSEAKELLTEFQKLGDAYQQALQSLLGPSTKGGLPPIEKLIIAEDRGLLSWSNPPMVARPRIVQISLLNDGATAYQFHHPIIFSDTQAYSAEVDLLPKEIRVAKETSSPPDQKYEETRNQLRRALKENAELRHALRKHSQPPAPIPHTQNPATPKPNISLAYDTPFLFTCVAQRQTQNQWLKTLDGTRNEKVALHCYKELEKPKPCSPGSPQAACITY